MDSITITFDDYLKQACLTEETVCKWTPLVSHFFGGRTVDANGFPTRIPTRAYEAYQKALEIKNNNNSLSDIDKINAVRSVFIKEVKWGLNPLRWIFLVLSALKAKFFRNEITQGAYDFLAKETSEVVQEILTVKDAQAIWAAINAKQDPYSLSPKAFLPFSPGGLGNRVLRERFTAFLTEKTNSTEKFESTEIMALITLQFKQYCEECINVVKEYEDLRFVNEDDPVRILCNDLLSHRDKLKTSIESIESNPHEDIHAAIKEATAIKQLLYYYILITVKFPRIMDNINIPADEKTTQSLIALRKMLNEINTRIQKDPESATKTYLQTQITEFYKQLQKQQFV